MTLETDIIYRGDCIELMTKIPDGSVDMILCDLPYGITDNEWDKVIPWEPLWTHYLRIAKPNAAIVLTAQGRFTYQTIRSQEKLYRYKWVWQKTAPRGFLNARRRPLSAHEDVLVFYRSLPTYNPQMTVGKPYRHRKTGVNSTNYGPVKPRETDRVNPGTRYPTDVLTIPNSNFRGIHPTQKPLALFEYLIQTYTNPGELVLDNCAGSGTTAIAALNTGRHYICIEQNPAYAAAAQKRIENWIPPTNP